MGQVSNGREEKGSRCGEVGEQICKNRSEDVEK